MSIPHRADSADEQLPLGITLAQEKMQGANSQIEAVEHHVCRNHQSNEGEPDCRHYRPHSYANETGVPSVTGRADDCVGPRQISRVMRKIKSMASSVYSPMNPSSVNSVLPECTCVEYPSDTRTSPYTSHGWRPTSAVIHPAVFAMSGNGKLISSSHKAHRVRNSAPRQRR